MERGEFLKTMGLVVSGILIPGVSADAMGSSSLAIEPVKIYDNYLKGVEYYDLLKYLKEIKEGDKLELIRYPEHKFDRFAIGVKWEGHFLGYIPAFENIVLANLMDSGVELSAKITAKHSFHKVGVGIWAGLISTMDRIQENLTSQAADEVEDWYRR